MAARKRLAVLLAAITVPVLCDIVIISVFGNSGLAEVFAGNTEFAQHAQESPEEGFYELLGMFPGSTFLIALATFSGLLFYLTSANSGAMVMSNFSSFIPDPAEDGAKWLRVFWSLLTAVLTIAMLIAGGVTTMEYATLIFALPVTVIAWLVMASFLKALRMERAEREGRTLYERQGDLRTLIASVTQVAVDGTNFLTTNRKDLVDLAIQSEPLLTALARYSPTFGCTFENFAGLVPEADVITGKGTENPGVRVNLQFVNPRGR